MRWAVTKSMASLKREQNDTPDNEIYNRCASSSTYESTSSSTTAPTPNLTNTLNNMPKPTAHTPNHSPTSLTTPPKMRWSQEEYIAYQWQEDTRGAATQNTTYRALVGNTTWENDNNLLPPSPPNEPAPTFFREHHLPHQMNNNMSTAPSRMIKESHSTEINGVTRLP